MFPMMKPRLILPLVASLLAPFCAAQEVKIPEKKNFQLFILAGQSNMAGRGKVDDIARQTNSRILAMNKKLEWQLAVDPLHWDKSAAGTGIGKPFAEIIAAKNPGITIGLVPTACGGSSIKSWVPGATHDQTKSKPWDDAIERAKLAMKDGTLAGILWHQGESDSNPKASGDHEKELEDLINRFRTELNAPDLPFIIGQLGRFPAKPWTADREKVDAAQRAVAKKMKNVRFVEAEGLTSSDNLHFDTPSLRKLAQGYADAYLDITK